MLTKDCFIIFLYYLLLMTKVIKETKNIGIFGSGFQKWRKHFLLFLSGEHSLIPVALMTHMKYLFCCVA